MIAMQSYFFYLRQSMVASFLYKYNFLLKLEKGREYFLLKHCYSMMITTKSITLVNVAPVLKSPPICSKKG